MEKHKKDITWQGLYNYKDADWTKCRDVQCPLISKCEIELFSKTDIKCIENKIPLVKITEAEKQSCLDQEFSSHNVTSDAFLDAVIAHVAGTSTPTLAADYGYFTSRFDPPDETTTIAIDDHQVGANQTLTLAVSGKTITITITLATTACNCLDTTIAAGTWSTTVFDLTSVTGLDVGGGDMLQITMATYGLQEREIASISGSTVTLTEALPAIPAGGEVARQILSNIYICMADNTVISADAYGLFKSSAISRVITATLRLIRN